MSVVTLTSDWNADDYYIASVKGKIISRCPDTTLIDVSNQIPPFNIAFAAFILRHSFRHFPDGTVHIIAVNSETRDIRPIIAFKYNRQYFITHDNGIVGLLLDEDPDEVVSFGNLQPGTFPELNVFADVACDIINSGKLNGTVYKELYKQVPMLPAIEESVINGSVIYIDSYKNAITNISNELFQQIGKGRPFEIFIQSNHYKINRINNRYGESSAGEMLAVFNSLNLLEIAINKGNAADLLNLGLNSPIRIKFKQL